MGELDRDSLNYFLLTAPMKFASLLIDMNFIGQVEPQRSQSFWVLFCFSLRRRKAKKHNILEHSVSTVPVPFAKVLKI